MEDNNGKKAAGSTEREKMGDCFKCRHHGTIERICRITGTLCKYPTRNCPNRDYPWGE